MAAFLQRPQTELRSLALAAASASKESVQPCNTARNHQDHPLDDRILHRVPGHRQPLRQKAAYQPAQRAVPMLTEKMRLNAEARFSSVVSLANMGRKQTPQMHIANPAKTPSQSAQTPN